MERTWKETVEELRRLANSIEQNAKRLTLPVQEITIPEVYSRMKNTLEPGAYFSIRLEITSGVGEPEIVFALYDGRCTKTFEAASLADAFNSWLALKGEQPKEPLAVAQSIMAECF